MTVEDILALSPETRQGSEGRLILTKPLEVVDTRLKDQQVFHLDKVIPGKNLVSLAERKFLWPVENFAPVEQKTAS